MAKRSERSLVLSLMIFAFVCLLFSGGWRLIGTQGEETTLPVRPQAQMHAAFDSMPAPHPQTGLAVRHELSSQRCDRRVMPSDRVLTAAVLSDANGNVLGGKTYLRAVYQAFTLDDGFV